MCGGKGQRLWPLSGEQKPKQFLPLLGDKSSLQKMLMLMSDRGLDVMMIGNALHQPEIKRQCAKVDLEYTEGIWERTGKNTAYATALLCHRVYQKYGEEAIVVIAPSDHHWGDGEQFIEGLNSVIERISRSDEICCIGVAPRDPSTEYGYIFLGNRIGGGLSRVDSFTEKPSLERAQKYIRRVDCAWNSGVYCAKASVILDEIKRLSPEIYSESRRDLMNADYEDMDLYLGESDERDDYLSLDRVVVEKCHSKMVCFNLENTEWEDMGSFKSLFEINEHGKKLLMNVNMLDVINSYAYSEDKPLYIMGMEGVIVLNLQDKIIVTHQSHIRELKHNMWQMGIAPSD